MTEHLESRIAATEPLLTPLQLKEALSLSDTHRQFIHQSRQTIARILRNKDQRLLLIVGPCSIHDSKSAKEYASRLKELASQVQDTFFIAMRVYFEKPRTTIGWKGMVYDPHLDGSHEIQQGLMTARKLLLDLAEMHMPAGTELLDPLAACYLHDLFTWGSVGARTTTSQIHRQMASGLSMPIGFKNSTDGNLDLAINAVIAAEAPHSHFGIDEHGRPSVIHTMGNPHTHIVLRGGENAPNYSSHHVTYALSRLEKSGVVPRLMIDCSHDNCYKKHHLQPEVFQDVIAQIKSGQKGILGAIIESHLLPGNQPLSQDKSQLAYGLSVTDECLDWESTKSLILEGRKQLQKQAVCV
jgi:3-deoxy-7-phosphoheptulonate synthase